MYDYLPRSLEFYVIMLARRANRHDIKINFDGQIAYIGRNHETDNGRIYNLGVYKDHMAFGNNWAIIYVPSERILFNSKYFIYDKTSIGKI